MLLLKNVVLINIYVGSAGRPAIRHTAMKTTFADIGFFPNKSHVPFVQYIEFVKQSKFVVAPPGPGEDTIRLWESVFFGAIPIIRNNTGLWPLFKRIPAFILPESEWKSPVKRETLLNFDIGDEREKFGRNMLSAEKWFKVFDRFKRRPDIRQDEVKLLYEKALNEEFELL